MPAQLGAYNLFTAWEQWNINNVNVVSHAVKSIVSPKILPSLVTKEIYNYRFDAIAGTIPDEVKEIVDFINNPKKYATIAIDFPKGILLYGPPGTGKTSLARAIAGEANAAFFAKSAADFVELYVGNGPKHIRELFDKARFAVTSGEYTKAIIFIDELDAIGCSRDVSDREYHNTLNELLYQMDGFVQDASIIVIGATNRVEDLDKALLRPGRFDRLIEICLPDIANRQAILEFYARKLKLNVPDKLFPVLARKTANYSGAELKNLVREAALFAIRENVSVITDTHFALSMNKVMEQKKIR